MDTHKYRNIHPFNQQPLYPIFMVIFQLTRRCRATRRMSLLLRSRSLKTI